MPSLKDLKTRINSVKSTQKITSAMKMVAAAKLRRAQAKARNLRRERSALEAELRRRHDAVADMESRLQQLKRMF